MASPIECLPVEVFELIASDLDLPAYRNLRLSSRQLHTLSFSIFAKRYFGELTTTLGSPSLERLVGVSSHGYLSDFVKTLDITILSQYEYTLMSEIDRVGVFPPPKRFPRVSGVSLAYISREATLYDDVSSPKSSIVPVTANRPNMTSPYHKETEFSEPNVSTPCSMPS
jgi:hypothetical protein